MSNSQESRISIFYGGEEEKVSSEKSRYLVFSYPDQLYVENSILCVLPSCQAFPCQGRTVMYRCSITIIMPVLTDLTAQMNLSVLKRYSPQTTSVVTTASYAVVYIFNTATVTWDRLNIEGTLFIVALNGACPPSALMEKRKRHRRPQKQREPTGPEEYQLIILNRRNLDNFIIPLTSPEDVESTDKFVILRSRTRCGAVDLQIQQEEGVIGDKEPITYGLWVWGEINTVAGDRERIEKIVRELSERVLKGKSITAGIKVNIEHRVPSPTQLGPQASQNYEDNGESNSDDPGNCGGVPMTARSISLTDLFNQQRKEDEEFSRTHQRPVPFPQDPRYSHHYQAPAPLPHTSQHQQHNPPLSYDYYYQQNPNQELPGAPPQQAPHFAPTSKFPQLHQQHTPTSSQSMPPPPKFLPTPAPQGGMSIYPTPPLPPGQSSRPTSQSQILPIGNYRTPSSSSSTFPGYAGIGSSSGGSGVYTMPSGPDYPSQGGNDIIARLFHNAAVTVQNSGVGGREGY